MKFKLNKKLKGFNIIELLITMGIISIVSLLAIPSISNNNQYTAARQLANRLKYSLNNARIQALQYNTSSVICPLKNKKCIKDWNSGLSVFLDKQNNKRLDSADIILDYYQNNNKTIKIAFRNRSYRYISFLPTGTSNFTSLYICGTLSKKNYYRVIINRSGRVRVEKSNKHQYC